MNTTEEYATALLHRAIVRCPDMDMRSAMAVLQENRITWSQVDVARAYRKARALYDAELDEAEGIAARALEKLTPQFDALFSDWRR
jgi:hypothetical protein